jgi:dihydroorotase
LAQRPDPNGLDQRRETISDGWIASRSKWTPYDGKRVTGWPAGTIIRGSSVMWDGELVMPSGGEPLRFVEALPRTQ